METRPNLRAVFRVNFFKVLLIVGLCFVVDLSCPRRQAQLCYPPFCLFVIVLESGQEIIKWSLSSGVDHSMYKLE
eukprot:1153289-Pelagomonas_calceolata.AAC.7